MSFKKMIGLLLCGSVLFSGCGETICQKAERVTKSLNTKTGSCFPLSTVPNVATCETTSKTCSDEDVKGIHRMLDCFDKLPSCNPDAPSEFERAVSACQDELGEGSSTCLLQSVGG
jgi:hypothetical protein